MVHDGSLILQPASEERSVSEGARLPATAVTLCLLPTTDIRDHTVRFNQRLILTIDCDLTRVDTVD